MYAYNLFVDLTLGGVGHVGSFILIMLQIFTSAFFVIRTLFAIIRKRSLLVKIMAIMVPAIFMFTWLIMATIVFSSFFSSYWDDAALARLISQTFQPAFVREILLWLALFAGLTVVYTLCCRLPLWDWLLSFALDLLAALLLLILYGGLLLPGFPYTIYDLAITHTGWVRLPIYCLYMVIFKDFVLATALLLGLLLRERPPRHADPTEFPSRQAFCDKQVQLWLTKDYLALGGLLLFFGSCVSAFFLYIMLREGATMETNEEKLGYLALCLIVLAPLGFSFLGLSRIAQGLLPQYGRTYRHLLSLAPQARRNQEEMVQLFYDEIVAAQPVYQLDSWRNLTSITSPHFTITFQGMITKLSWHEPPVASPKRAWQNRRHAARKSENSESPESLEN